MILKKNRLNKKDVDLIFKKGFFFKTNNILFRFLKIKEEIEPKISFISPKKVNSSAVKRNLLKRRGYSLINKHLKDFPSGFLGAFIFSNKSYENFGLRGEKKEESLKKLELEIKEILNKLKIN